MTVTPFSSTHAVETWDAWFRWRERGRLRDVTVEDTWARVASAVSAGLRTPRADFAPHLFDAMHGWKLLLDERLLASAGTPSPQWDARNLGAALNVAAFVRAPGMAHATLDLAALQESACLAVCALDAAARAIATDMPPRSLHIGLLGVGDALHALGLEYDSDAACAQVAAVAAALAHSSLSCALALARAAPPAVQPDPAWFERAARRALPREWLDAAARHGVAFDTLTAIVPQQRLASFANRASDALDPVLEPAATPSAFDVARGAPLRLNVASAHRHAPAVASVAAQLRLRAVAQPWIDAPIDYPVVCAAAPDSGTQETWRAQALELGLVPPLWRLATADAGVGAPPRQPAAV